MARDFNQNRNTNAKLGEVNITRYGKTWAIQYGFDGANIINNAVAPVPTDIKEYLEGNDNITVFACASNIDKLCEYALTSFPSIEDLYLFKTSAIVVLEDDLSYLLDLNKIYVPSDLLSAYISAYPTLSTKFDTIVEDYTLTIPFIGDTTLTSAYVDSVIAMLSSAEKNAISVVEIPSNFVDSEIILISLFSSLTNLEKIKLNKFRYIFNVNDYTVNEFAFDNEYIYVEKSLILDLQYGYFDIIRSIDIYGKYVYELSSTYQITKASLIDMLNNIPTQRKQEIRTIKFGNDFPSYETRFLDAFNEVTGFANELSLYFTRSADLDAATWSSSSYYAYSHWADSNNKFKTLYVKNEGHNSTVVSYNGIMYCYTVYPKGIGGDYVYSKGGTSGIGTYNYLLESLTSSFGGPGGGNKYLPNLKTVNSISGWNTPIFFGQENVVLTGSGHAGATDLPHFFYFPATVIKDYTSNSQWTVSTYNRTAGVIDGNDVYTKYNFNYPKLKGIDTEANIQLLSVDNNSLYLASDTGNLWKYNNGTWTNLFSGYTPTWYRNKETTTTISSSIITISMTVYVKLTAI